MGNVMSKNAMEQGTAMAGTARCGTAGAGWSGVFLRGVAHVGVVLAVLLMAQLASSGCRAEPGPFARLAGNWRGVGSALLDDGSTERLRCRASYGVGGSTMRMALYCASDSYKLSFSADVVSDGRSIGGQWSEASHGLSGPLHGRGGGNSFHVVAQGAGFNASISLSVSGTRQQVTMRSGSINANISLSR